MGPSSEERFDAAIDTLRTRGERVTTARRAVLRILADSADHLSAESLAAAVGTVAPRVHRATVYRTLESLTRSGLVTHVHLPHGPAAYHLADPEQRVHLHLACSGCGRIVDAPPDLLDPVQQRLASSVGFTLDPDHVALTGRCAECGPD